MWFGNANELYRDVSGNILGPDVKLVLTTFDGDQVIEMIPAAVATALLLHNDLENGSVFYSGHIEHCGVIDVWGGSA